MPTSGGEESLNLFLNGASNENHASLCFRYDSDETNVVSSESHPDSSSLITSFDTNLFIFSYDIMPPLNGGVLKNRESININGGKNMEALLQRYHDYLCGEHSRKNTIDNKLGATRSLLRQTNGIINPETIQQLKIWANQHYSHNSRNNKINAWNEFLRWYGCPELKMKHIGFIETNQHALTEQEIDTLLSIAQNNPLENLVILLLFDGARRPSEIINIRIDHRDNNRLCLDNTKTGNKRIILSPMLIHAWDDYLKIRPQPRPGHEHYLILKDKYKHKGTKYVDTHPINDMINNIARLAGIKEVTPYTIRRTSATLRLCKYSKYYMGDPKLVKELFGHTDFATTMRYDRTSETDIERYFNETQGQSTIHPEVSTINKRVSTINEKGSTTNLIYVSPQSITRTEENDNNTFSFSFSFFNTISSEAWDSIVCDPPIFIFFPPERYAHASVLMSTPDATAYWQRISMSVKFVLPTVPDISNQFLFSVTENLNQSGVAWSVTGLCDYPLLPMPSTFPCVASSFVCNLPCTSVRTTRGFLEFFFILFSSPHEYVPGSHGVQPQVFRDGSSPRCGVASGERIWNTHPVFLGVQRVFGQVKAPEYQMGGID